MEKISEMGKLYLKDYYVLMEAQDQSHTFLNTVLENVINRIEERREELPDLGEDYYWKTWSNKTNLGHYQIYLKTKKENKLLRANRVDIIINYRDVRHTTILKDPTAVRISIDCTNYFNNKVNKISQSELDEASSKAIEIGTSVDYVEKRLFNNEINLNLSSASDSAELIADELIERAIGIAVFIESVVDKNNINI
jgi:hypothetical protein